MNHFETVREIIFKRVAPYNNGRSDETLRNQIIAQYMRYYAGVHDTQREYGAHYHFSQLDIDLISNHIIADIRNR